MDRGFDKSNFPSAGANMTSTPEEASTTLGPAMNGLQGSTYAGSMAGKYGTAIDTVGAYPSKALPSFAAVDNTLAQAGVPGRALTTPFDANAPPTKAPATTTAPADPATGAEAAKPATKECRAQKAIKAGINVGVAAIPGIGPILGAGNLISALLGRGTIGSTVADNYQGGAAVGSPATADADHNSNSSITGTSAAQGGYGTNYGYGALDPSTSVTGTGTGTASTTVDPNAAATTAFAAMWRGQTAAAPSTAASILASLPKGDYGAYAPPTFYNPMNDPVVLNALKVARGPVHA